MSSQTFVFLLLILTGLFFAFPVGDYLYKNETASSVSYLNFTLDDHGYSIVKVAGVESFLLKDGSPMTNSSDISDVLHEYYVKTYYPTSTELDNLRGLITRFNDSRNNGYDYKNKEEYFCRNEVLYANGKISISGKPITCTNETTCQKNAMILYSIYSEGWGLGSITQIFQPLKDFALSSFAMDAILANYTARLDALNDSNAWATMDYIKNNTDALKAYSLKVEATPFRIPRLNDSKDKTACTRVCWGACPSLDLDQAALDSIKSTSTALSAKVAPLNGFQITQTRLSTQTIARLAHASNESTAASFLYRFNALNASGVLAIVSANATLTHVSNSSLSEGNARLTYLQTSIPAEIAARNFTATESKLREYAALSPYLSNLSVVLSKEFDDTKKAKDTNSAYLTELETKDLDPASSASFTLIKNRTADLDLRFRDGLTSAQLGILKSNYSGLSTRSQALLRSDNDQPAAKSVVLLNSMAKHVNAELANFSATSKIIDTSQFETNPTMTFGSISVIVFVGFSSLALLVFLYLMVSMRAEGSRGKKVLTSAFVCGIVFILVFSIFTFVLLNKTAHSATLSDFKSDLGTKTEAAVFVDLRAAPYDVGNNMALCGRQLSDALAAKNLSTSLYVISSSACDSPRANLSLNRTDCLARMENSTGGSSFRLSFTNQTEPLKLSIIYRSVAEINGNADYYRSCPIVSVFG